MAPLTRRAALVGALAACALPRPARASASRVLVVGGGPAGLSAALELAERGVPVTLLEASPRLGGKVCGWEEALGGDAVDVEHGVHGLNRGYLNMTELLERYGLGSALRAPEPFGSAFLLREGLFRLTPLRVPALMAALRGRARALGYKHLNLSFARGRRWVKSLTRERARAELGGRSVTDWHAAGAPLTPFRVNAEMLSLSMYFVPPAQLDAATFALAERWNTPEVRWMRGNPQALLWEPLGQVLRALGGKLRLSTPVESLWVEGGVVRGVTLGAGPQRWEVPAPGDGWTAAATPGGGQVWLGRGDDGSPLAILSRCTHAGCPVHPSPEGFFCPCHGGRYGPTGLVLGGPPPSPLPRLRVQELGDTWSLELEGAPERLEAHAVVLAVDAPAFARLAGPVLPGAAGLRGVRHTVARFWLDRDLPRSAPAAVVCEVCTHTSNAFLLHRLQDASARWAQAHGGAVVELQAFRALPLSRDPEVLLDAIEPDLARIWPELAQARVLKRTLTQGDGFTGFGPGWHTSAPAVETGAPGLYAAGDFIRVSEDCEFMERAVTTGRQAANAILRGLGLPERPVLDWRS